MYIPKVVNSQFPTQRDSAAGDEASAIIKERITPPAAWSTLIAFTFHLSPFTIVLTTLVTSSPDPQIIREIHSSDIHRNSA